MSGVNDALVRLVYAAETQQVYAAMGEVRAIHLYVKALEQRVADLEAEIAEGLRPEPVVKRDQWTGQEWG